MFHDAFELDDDEEEEELILSRQNKYRAIQENIIDTKAQQSRPRGPRNKVNVNYLE